MNGARSVSLIIPTLSRLNDLEITLEAVQAGTVLPDEIIIVDTKRSLNNHKKALANGSFFKETFTGL